MTRKMLELSFALAAAVAVACSPACEPTGRPTQLQEVEPFQPTERKREFHPVVEEWLACTECSLITSRRLRDLGTRSFQDLERVFDAQWGEVFFTPCVARQQRSIERNRKNPRLSKTPQSTINPETLARSYCERQLQSFQVRALQAFPAIGSPEAHERLTELAGRLLPKSDLAPRVRAALKAALAESRSMQVNRTVR